MSIREELKNIVDGNDRVGVLYGKLMSVVIIASLVPLCFKESNVMLETIELVCVTIFIADYIARWITADLRMSHGKWSFVVYPFTPMAIIDLVSILPVFIALNPAWRAARILRLFRALRAFKLIRGSKSMTAVLNVFVKQREALTIVFGLAVAYVLLSALVVFNVEPDTFATFFDAVYWAMVSLTTVGYGDLYPASEAGRVVAMVSSFMGIAVVALPSGIITAGMLEELGED